MAARENYDISTLGLTDRCSASELPRHIAPYGAGTLRNECHRYLGMVSPPGYMSPQLDPSTSRLHLTPYFCTTRVYGTTLNAFSRVKRVVYYSSSDQLYDGTHDQNHRSLFSHQLFCDCVCQLSQQVAITIPLCSPDLHRPEPPLFAPLRLLGTALPYGLYKSQGLNFPAQIYASIQAAGLTLYPALTYGLSSAQSK